MHLSCLCFPYLDICKPNMLDASWLPCFWRRNPIDGDLFYRISCKYWQKKNITILFFNFESNLIVDVMQIKIHFLLVSLLAEDRKMKIKWITLKYEQSNWKRVVNLVGWVINLRWHTPAKFNYFSNFSLNCS